MPKGPGLASIGDCAYYNGVGICSFGCWEEPSCQTDEPEGGWLAYEVASLREYAWEQRGNHGRVKHTRDVMRHFARREVAQLEGRHG